MSDNYASLTLNHSTNQQQDQYMPLQDLKKVKSLWNRIRFSIKSIASRIRNYAWEQEL